MTAAIQRDFSFRADDFLRIARLVKERAGINLGANKRDLVYGRLSRRLRALHLDDFSDYCALVESDEGAAECRSMINAITTNLTAFFREPHHFQFLSNEVLAALLRARATGQRRLRIWSAGCSSGEEPYSIAMTLHQTIDDLPRWDARILATDIDSDMVATAAAGRYASDRAAAIPAAMRRQYVSEIEDGDIEIDETLKSLIAFKALNLLDAWPMRGPFDVIFCRNVVIYFDKPTQRTLFNRFADILTPEGWLFIGHSESLFQVSDRFRHMGRTIYRRIS